MIVRLRAIKNAVPKNVRMLVESMNHPIIGPKIIVKEPIEDKIPFTHPASLLSVCVIISVVYNAHKNDARGDMASHRIANKEKSCTIPIIQKTIIPTT